MNTPELHELDTGFADHCKHCADFYGVVLTESDDYDICFAAARAMTNYDMSAACIDFNAVTDYALRRACE